MDIASDDDHSDSSSNFEKLAQHMLIFMDRFMNIDNHMWIELLIIHQYYHKVSIYKNY